MTVHDPKCPAVKILNTYATLGESRAVQTTACQCELILSVREHQKYLDEAAIGYPHYLKGRTDAATDLTSAYDDPEISHKDDWGVSVLYKRVAVNVALQRPPFGPLDGE
jgi:hypothetical protein